MNALRIERILPAPPERVWAAFTDPAALAAWFWPTSFGTTVRVDARAGGRFRIAASDGPGGALAVEGAYTVVELARSLGFTWRWDGDDEETLVTGARLSAVGRLTRADVDARTLRRRRHPRQSPHRLVGLPGPTPRLAKVGRGRGRTDPTDTEGRNARPRSHPGWASGVPVDAAADSGKPRPRMAVRTVSAREGATFTPDAAIPARRDRLRGFSRKLRETACVSASARDRRQ